MFHVNSWGLQHAAVAAGATLVNPGPKSAQPIAELMESDASQLQRESLPYGWVYLRSQTVATCRVYERSRVAVRQFEVVVGGLSGEDRITDLAGMGND